MEYSSSFDLALRSWIFTCSSCHSSMIKRLGSGIIGLEFPCPLCKSPMRAHLEASLIYQRKEAEAN